MQNDIIENNYTYVTALSDTSYIPGVVALNRSIIKSKCQYHLLCLTSNDVLSEAKCIFDRENINYKCADNLSFDTESLNGKDSSWNKTFFKLKIFELDEYDKCVYLDADMIMVRNADELFSFPTMSAVKDDYQFTLQKWGGRLNSGTLVFKPNKCIAKELIDLTPRIIERYKNEGRAIGDQDILNEYFAEWKSDSALHLSEIYNCAINMIEKQKKIGKADYKLADIKIVHFVGRYKPWIGHNCLKFCIERITKLKFFEAGCFLRFYLLSK